jgi:hypothetical protein
MHATCPVHLILLYFIIIITVKWGDFRPAWLCLCHVRDPITYIRSTEVVSEQWKESVIVPVHKNIDRADCRNYRGTSLLLTSYKNLFNILFSGLSPHVNKITADHQCGFRSDWSDLLHSSDTGEEIGVQWDSTSAIRRLQESPWFS